jgi:hypothetical protein
MIDASAKFVSSSFTYIYLQNTHTILFAKLSQFKLKGFFAKQT